MSKKLSSDGRSQLQEEMRSRWEARARGRWRRNIWAEAGDSEEAFRSTGERDYRRYVGKFLSALGVDPARLIALEIGCGAGRISEFMACDFYGLVALDVSKEIMRNGKRRVPADNVLWLCGDGLSLKPLADNSVDFIFSLSVFQQIPDVKVIAGYIEEAGRALKKGGWLVFQVMNHPHVTLGPWTASFFISRRFHVPRMRLYKPDPIDAGPIRLGLILKTCDQSGLEVVRVLHRFTQNTWIWARKRL